MSAITSDICDRDAGAGRGTYRCTSSSSSASNSAGAWHRSSGSRITCEPVSTTGSCHADRAGRRYDGTGTATPSAGTGTPRASRSGTTPAQYGSPRSPASSTAPPERGLTETSPSGSASTAAGGHLVHQRGHRPELLGGVADRPRLAVADH